MKILFVINRFPSSGHNIHTYNLAKALSKSHELSLVCFENNSQFVKEDKYYTNIQIVPFKKKNFIKKGFKSLLLNAPFCVLTHQSQSMANAIKTICQKVKFDIVMFEPLVMGQYHYCVQDCLKILFPVDATSRIKEQRLYEEKNILTKFVRFIDYLMVRRYEKVLYNRFDGIIFSSNYDSEYTLKNIKISPEKVCTLPEGVDLSYFHPAYDLSFQKTSLAFLGNMDHYPNHHGMLWFYNNVWKTLKKEYPNLYFYIVGNNPGQEIKNLSLLDKNIIVTGYVDDIRPYIWQASIFVSPLQIGTGMKNKVLQAMAMGKAIVASPLDIQGTQVEDGKHVLVAKTPEDFIKKIVFLIRDKEKREELGYNARKYVEKWHSIEAKGDRFINFVSTKIKKR